MSEQRLCTLVESITPPSAEVSRAAWDELSSKTKPPGSLGRIETIAAQLAAISGSVAPAPLAPAIVVMAGDHGVAAQGVSAFPQAVTEQMLLNFAAGGAAINALSRSVGARLLVVDVGTLGATPAGVLDRKVRSGTRDITLGPAMTREEAYQALLAGVEVAERLADDGFNLICLGEMGIANTTAASALSAVLTGAPVAQLVGRGTGIDRSQLEHKRSVVERALLRNECVAADPMGCLAALGGFEIAALTGVALGAAGRGIAVVLDGFIASTAVLAAERLAPEIRGYLFAAHRSQEPGHEHVLRALELQPLLELELRLGEGSGAALSVPLFRAALAILNEMATFDTAGVSTQRP